VSYNPSKVSLRFAAILISLLLPFSADPQTRPGDARAALFLRSDLESAISQSEAGLRESPRNSSLLFVRMEAAALQADTATTLDTALRLCSPTGIRGDPRFAVAGNRILDLAGNNEQFRRVIPRIRQMLVTPNQCSSYLRASLIAAASEGAKGLDLLSLSRESGLITDWRIAGPFGRYSNVAFEQSWAPERDLLKQEMSGGKAVERVRFEDGNFQLPDYFGHNGIFYAAATINSETAVQRLFRIESPGTIAVFLDGRMVLRKDNRFRAGSDVAHVVLRLRAGQHSVLLKFLRTAVPFRVAVLPPPADDKESSINMDPAEVAYVTAALNFWAGDYVEAAAQLSAILKTQPSSAAQFLLAQTWQRSSGESPDETSYLLSALKLSPSAMAIQFRLAEKALASGRTDEAWQRVTSVLAARPDFVPALEMAARIATSRNWNEEEVAAFDALVRFNPTCNVLSQAYTFYSGRSQFELANELLNRIETCAPQSTTYVELLSQAGKHDQASRAAAILSRSNPLSRSARYLLVRELALAGRHLEARDAAQQLARLSPNSARFQAIANSPDEYLGLLDEDSPRARDFQQEEPFYTPYRRDTLAIVNEAAGKKLSGPAITLLDDKVARIDADGTATIYVHKLLKVLTRSGVETFGEVSLPPNAEILELRTIGMDGTIAEPEFQEHKATVSMPAVLPGAVIEQEYVVRFSDNDSFNTHRDEFVFTFGSTKIAVAKSRFVALTPAPLHVATQALNGAPDAETSIKAGERIQIWERQDISQLALEPSLPSREVMPSVNVFEVPADGWSDVRDHFRDLLINATKIGPRTQAVLNGIRVTNENDRLRAIYSFVSSRIRSDKSTFAEGNVTSAEDTLAAYTGNRTVALIALARAAGFEADLFLCQDESSGPAVVSLDTFTRPLVRITGRGVTLIADAETEGMGIGLVAPTIRTREALLVPVTNLESRALAAVNHTQSELSVADADVKFNAEGDLEARLIIKLGPWRASQMRNTLAGMEAAGRQQYLNQLAARIFPGTTEVTGDIRNDRDLSRPLEILVHCRAPRFLNMTSSRVDMDQLAPELALRRLYAAAATRRYPLFLNTPLSERTVFRVILPPNALLTQKISAVDLRTSFGRYAISSRETGNNMLEITREFDIPVQVITPGNYSDFLAFASRIDEAERQRFALDRTSSESGSSSAAQ
jgi:tetratricopeptide (TPR) repeat protein